MYTYMNPIPGSITSHDEYVIPNDILEFVKKNLEDGSEIFNCENIKTQIVSGIMYYFDAHVDNKITKKCSVYKVKIQSQPWAETPIILHSISLL